MGNRKFHRACTFTEVMFAVILLGVGFIMIAAMFPVAIQQTKATVAEAAAPGIAEAAMDYLQQVANDYTTLAGAEPPAVIGLPDEEYIMNQVYANGTAPPDRYRSNQIVQTDPRFAWVPMYKRQRVAPGETPVFAQVYMFVVQAKNYSTYRQERDLNGVNYAASGYSLGVKLQCLQPRAVRINITYKSAGTGWMDWVTIWDLPNPPYPGGGNTINQLPNGQTHPPVYISGAKYAATTGAYMIICDDRGTRWFEESPYNGRILRLGNQKQSASSSNPAIFELIPGYDTVSSTEATALTANGVTANKGAYAYILGRGLKDPTKIFNDNKADVNYNPYEGPAQDVAFYTGYVRIN